MKDQALRKIGAMHPATLAFESAEMEDDYSLYLANKRIFLNRVAIVLAVVMYASFFIVDVLLAVDYMEAQALIRLVIVPASLLFVLGTTWSSHYPKFGERLIAFPLFVGTLGHVPMALLNGSFYASGFFSFALGLMLLYNFLLSGIRFRYSLLIGLVIVGSYEWIEFGLSQNKVEDVVTNHFFMISVYALGVISHYVLERFSRMEFLYRLERESFIDQVNREKVKSEKLLENILPKKIAFELKNTGRVEAQKFDHVTVMFIDIVGFTKLTTQVPADVLVGGLHEFFSAIDRIIRKYNLEKLKTVGDGYLCAGGVPRKSETHALDCCLAAQEILEYVKARHSEKFPIQIRVGINTGMVMAGIVGLDKFAYDIWGDAVNTACRLEQVCEPNQINISGSTRAAIHENFLTESRGLLPLKGKGLYHMYYLCERRGGEELASA
ncbi:adenylate/guanylate cyclase domain-containing protein [Pseudobacteriovorax antillogorgiicola]|uniref:Adenylate cyclase, class 3 n=1 Tax=Pseudobacteriovorax antillogorgiicola TaxID=1513793 RepID=A0A1Y6BI29_9BACT|nr:adenylate/guanylate cyclase domain-containing protein [Pseudobacteriovorax antillogorgiicola]TCS55513.1 class 3 adenylate cyclase [Pseudobacteriovorax antillogorgiicola]SMF11447.1 Adenylate cyclase, class 3 [Pseudobacteriovorax antillogorgiicola]